MAANPLYLLILAAAQPPSGDPVAACRAAYAGDAPRHIACLEEALGAPRPVPPAGLGADQLEARQRLANPHAPKVQQTVQIVSVTYDARGRGVFRTADGQVWRETEITPEHMRPSTQGQYTGRIEKAALGGYRLYIEGVRRMLKVERLE